MKVEGQTLLEGKYSLWTQPRPDTWTIDFPDFATGSTTLRFRWGIVVVPLHLTMIAPPLAMVPKGDRGRFVGRYDVEVLTGSRARRVR